MWTVWEHRRCRKQLDRLPVDVQKRYEKWKDIVVFSGPQGLRRIRGFRDEALHGRWRGHRSSRLNQQYRVIYRVVTQEISVEVVDVT
ncbi:MAG: type II toxin-antitoxin system mRNA interferase toxin, RelE/StbE family, partial [Acidobacteriota bacterium]